MQLTLYTDYSLRALVFLGLKTDSLATIGEISESYGISRNHLVKVIHNLSQLGYIDTVRGKGGGLRLALPARQIIIGDVIRQTAPNFNLVECFDKQQDSVCPITAVCKLKTGLRQAYQAFMAVLDGITLEDILTDSHSLSQALNIVVPFPAMTKKS